MADMKLEVLVLPVADVDRIRHFYEKLGFRLDIDHTGGEEFRVAQFTPPGSETSGAHPERADYGSFASFNDPDRNGWLLLEIQHRAPGR